MKKVILNKCYGGFSLSDLAYKRYAKKSGIKLFKYEMYINADTVSCEFRKVKNSDSLLFSYYVTKDLGKTTNELPKDYCFTLGRENREDPVLIEVIEELGEKANTKFSDLKIVEIPDDLDYVIDDYDGIETLHEKVQVW